MKKVHKSRTPIIAKVAVIVACTIVISIFFSGCMPYKELKDESIVEGMGIDSDGSGGYIVTFQIYKPQQSGGGGGGGGSSKGGDSSEVTILTSRGATLFDAIRNATLQMGRKLYFSNNRAYIISEDVGKTGITSIIDYMERNQQIMPQERIYVSKGKAAEILTYKKNDEIVPAENMELMSQDYSQTSKMVDVQLIDVFRDISTGITDPAIAATSIQDDGTGQKVMEMDGTAVFRNNKLVGFLNQDQTRGYLWIVGKVQGGVIPISLPEGGMASMAILSGSSKIDVDSTNGAPVVKVNIQFQTNLTEVDTQKDEYIDSDFLNKLESLQNNIVKSEAQSAAMAALHNYDSDIFGFGLSFYENKPKLWKNYSDNWDSYLKNMNVEINVTSSIKHTGLTLKNN